MSAKLTARRQRIALTVPQLAARLKDVMSSHVTDGSEHVPQDPEHVAHGSNNHRSDRHRSDTVRPRPPSRPPRPTPTDIDRPATGLPNPMALDDLLNLPSGAHSLHCSNADEMTLGGHWPASHPDDLVGRRAPATWDGVAQVYADAVISTGDSQPRDGTVVVVHRRDGGADIAFVGDVDGVITAALHTDVPAGRLDDVGRRILGRPTPAPELDVSAIAAWAWLDDIWSALISDEAPNYMGGWQRLAALHPARDVADDDTPWALAHALDERSQLWPWRRLRCTAARGEPLPEWGPFRRPEFALAVHEARWHDDGTFGRHFHTVLPEPRWLWDAVGTLVGTAEATRILRTVELSGLSIVRQP